MWISRVRLQRSYVSTTLLSLDDFGQGYSSISRLSDLPFESVKIDRALVTGCAADPI
jgi:EAL domain-containing protein (putative c-di-GMP-specific phosphodiesterase class I)